MIKNWNPIEENRKLKRRKNWMFFILLSLFIIFIFAIYPNTQVKPPSSSPNQGEESSPAPAPTSLSLPDWMTREYFKKLEEQPLSPETGNFPKSPTPPVPPDRQIRYWRELAETLAEQNTKQKRAWEYEAFRAEQERMRMKMEMEMEISDAISDMRNRLSKERESSDPLLELGMRNSMREQESLRNRYESDMRRMKRELDDLEDKINYRRRRD